MTASSVNSERAFQPSVLAGDAAWRGRHRTTDEAMAGRSTRSSLQLGAVVSPLAVALVALLTHGINMLRSPYLEDDEGSYTAYAWAVHHLGQLGPYHTYFYEHPPLGWIQIAAWQVLTGGIHSFGYGIASGRIFMLVVHVASALLVYSIGRRISGHAWIGVLAALMFTLTPFGIPYQRRVLLDNLCALWMLVSVYTLVQPRMRLRHVWLSALALATAILSKEVAVAIAPAIALLAARRLSRHNRLFGMTGWSLILASVVSFYGLMALLKGEFFPAGSALGGSRPHTSLLCTLEWQASRGQDGGIANPASAFWQQVAGWTHADPVIFVGGTVAALVAALMALRAPAVATLGLSALLFLLFLARGGIVIGFYLVPALPFLALSLACITGVAYDALSKRAAFGSGWARGSVGLLLAGACLLPMGAGVSKSASSLWQADPVQGQLDAVRWIQQHLSPRSGVVLDEYMWMDLHAPSTPGQAPFHRAQYYWKVGADPEIAKRFFHDDWRNVQYVITTPELLSDTAMNGFPIVRAALDHSTSVARFDTGLPVDIRRVNPHSRSRDDFHWVPPTQSASPSCMTPSG